MLHPIPLTLFIVLLLMVFLFLFHVRQRKEFKTIDKDQDTSPKYHQEQLLKLPID